MGKPRKRTDGRWEAREWIDGRRRSFYGATRAEAVQKRREALAATKEPPR